MNRNDYLITLVAVTNLYFGQLQAAQNPAKHLDSYQQQGASQADINKGKALWYSESNKRSCTRCHGDNPSETGRHTKTGKIIQPMAFSVNPDRYQDSRKIEKWFLRNCKWTFGRTCSVQEKADILTWLTSQ